MTDCGSSHDHASVRIGQVVDVTIPSHATNGVNPYNGPMESAVVSQSTKVCRGEFVRKVLEYAPHGDAMKCLTMDVHILDAMELSQGRVGVVFAQGNKTKFKVVALDGDDLVMGNTLVLAEEAVEAAALVELARNKAAVVYSSEGCGMVAVVTLEERFAALAFTDIWAEGDPANLCACAMGQGILLVAAMLQVKTPTGNPGEMWAWAMQTTDNTPDSFREISRIRVDVDSDVDVYDRAWSLTSVTQATAVLTFFRGMEKPIGFALLDIDRSAYNHPLSVRLIGTGKYATSLPCISTAALDRGRWLATYGVSWMPSGGNVKSALAVEVWGLTRYAAELMWYGCDDATYDAGIGAVSALTTGVGAALNYTPNLSNVDAAVGKSLYLALDDGGPAPGATIPLTAHDGFCRAVPISQTRAILIWQKAGNAYIRALQVEERVSPSNQLIHGLAITSGGPGERISMRVSDLGTE